MQTEQQSYSRHYRHDPCHPCGERGYGAERRGGPEVFYGYCHQTRRMRMMDYPDYVNNMQTGLSNLVSGAVPAMQPLMDSMLSSLGAQPSSAASGYSSSQGYGHPGSDYRHHDPYWGHHHDCGCHEHERDCHCCIRCADLVEYARCAEVRQIPITFENETRRERDVKLELGSFLTESGLDLGWQPVLSETAFKLPACGKKTVLLTVTVDCTKLDSKPVTNPTGANTPGATVPPANTDQRPTPAVSACTVAYGTLRADGCTVRPLVIAIAILPSHCGAHPAGCGCGCC